MLDAICQVTGRPETFGSLPASTKATQLPAPDLVKNDFLKIFGQPERQTVCECERSSESNLGMAIQFFNGPLIYNKLRDENNRFRVLLKDSKPDDEIIRQLHLAAVNRLPTEKEISASMKHIAAKDEQIAKDNAEIQAKVAALRQAIGAQHAAARDKLIDGKLAAVPESLRADLKASLAVEAGKRNEVQKYLVEKLGASVAVSDEEATKSLDEAATKEIAASQAQIVELEKGVRAPGGRRIEALEDICWAILNTNEFLFQH